MHAFFEPAVGIRLVVHIQILKCGMLAQPGRCELFSDSRKATEPISNAPSSARVLHCAGDWE
jgi:hypothetical protein